MPVQQHLLTRPHILTAVPDIRLFQFLRRHIKLETPAKIFGA
jgi:hypothetical protein